jgi:hypothetical protein
VGAKRSELEADNFSVCCACRVVPQLSIHPDDLTGFNDLWGLSTVYGMLCVCMGVCMCVCMYVYYACISLISLHFLFSVG